MGEAGALWETAVMRIHLAGRDVVPAATVAAAATTDTDAEEEEEEAPGDEHVEATDVARERECESVSL